LQSNRDITGQAPIDKVTFPGIHVTPACHHDGVYDPDTFETCFSNLIAVGFRRLIIDLYWDVENRSYNLCPVHIPDFSNTTSDVDVEQSTATRAGAMPPRSALYLDAGLERRQTQSANATSSSTPSTSVSTSSGTTATNKTAATTASSAISTSSGDEGTALLNLGPYKCAQGLGLESIIDIVVDYIGDTSDASAATLQILEFNLHSTSLVNNPEGPPQNVSSGEYPSTSELVGYRWNSEMGSQLYDPRDLQADRANINNSWNQVRVAERLPITGYFNTETLSNGDVATEDGWPSELYLLLTRLERVIVTWGTIDREMEGYNFEADSSHVFAAGMLSDSHELRLNNDGVVTSGCFYRDDEKNVQQINNTWAVLDVNNTQGTANYDLQNISSCGVSPVLNQNLGNSSAGDKYHPYQLITQSLVLGWADGEPKNTSSPGVDSDGQFRCVVIDSSNDYRGKWRVVSCQDRYRAACRIGGQPYNWRLSSDVTDFTGAPDSCPNDSSFDLPVSQLENTYLYEHILQDVANSSDSSIQHSVWIDLNSLDSMDCWVTTGPNGTCRYQQNSQEERNRQVLIPTIAALIILILTVLTILVKCNVNRRNNRRHRIGPGGWEYEGVPS
jgi:hypothetical protein